MLTIKNLSVDYFQRDAIVHALKSISLEVSAGEVLGVVGESGSGKTTIALAVLRLIRAQEGKIIGGEIRLDHTDLLTLSDESLRTVRSSRVAMIFQDPYTALNPVLRIRDQMKEVLDTRTENDAASALSESALRDALGQVQLDPDRVLDAFPHQLSGGQRQRILIATALLGNPQLILADEPTTALDVLVQKEILELLGRLQKKNGFGMILISHNLAVVSQYAHRTAIMKEGVIVESGPTSDVLTNPQHPYARQLVAAVPHF